jgi:triacylglycerol esterase/lipase EstA (alpha/beta hydrolase family)
MAWRYLPHQLNNRKFDKAVVFVHGLNGSAKSWMGAPNRFVDRLSRVPVIYNHVGLYVFGYDPKIFEHGPLWKLFARIPGCSEIAQQRKFNADLKRISTELKATLQEMLPAYKTILFVGHGMGGLLIKRVLADLHEPPKTYYLDTDDTSDSALDIDDPDNHVAYNKALALLHDILDFAAHESRNAENRPG